MNFILSIIFIIVIGFITPSSFPWWTPIILCFLAGAILKTKSGLSFISGFLGMTLLWGIGIFIAYQNGADIIATRMTSLLQVPSSSTLIAVTLFIGSLLGGLACFSGNSLRKILQPK